MSESACDSVGKGRDEEPAAGQDHAGKESERSEAGGSGDRNNQPPCAEQRSEKPNRDWVDYAMLGALVFTFFAAVGAAFEANRLATDTEAGIEHADRIANGGA